MFAWAICNSVIIASFAALAIHFDKWWIVLFGIFFTFSFKSGSKSDDAQKEE